MAVLICSRVKKGEGTVQASKAFPSLLIVLMGTIDCVTTIIGIVYFGAVERNPFMSNVMSASLAGFTLLKMGTTFVVGLIFYHADSLLMKTPNKDTKVFVWTKRFLKVSCVGVIVFLSIVVLNNLIVLVNFA
jgi:hypothetical protein